MFTGSAVENKSNALIRFAAAIADSETILGKLKTEFPKEIERQFASNDWKPLSPFYALEKREKYGDKPILRATDALFLSYQNGANISGNTLTYGSSISYARKHQEGTGVPKRAFDTEFAATMSLSAVTQAIRTARYNSQL